MFPKMSWSNAENELASLHKRTCSLFRDLNSMEHRDRLNEIKSRQEALSASLQNLDKTPLPKESLSNAAIWCFEQLSAAYLAVALASPERMSDSAQLGVSKYLFDDVATARRATRQVKYGPGYTKMKFKVDGISVSKVDLQMYGETNTFAAAPSDGIIIEWTEEQQVSRFRIHGIHEREDQSPCKCEVYIEEKNQWTLFLEQEKCDVGRWVDFPQVFLRPPSHFRYFRFKFEGDCALREPDVKLQGGTDFC